MLTEEKPRAQRIEREFPKITAARPGRPAPAHRRQDRRDAGAVVPRGHARQHPALRARHRRRQSAVVRSRLRGEDPLRRHRRAAELPVRDQPHHLGLRRRPAGRPRDVVGRRLELAPADPAQRRDLDRVVPQGPDRARDPLCRTRRPADLSRRLLQPARRQGRRCRQLVLSHRARPCAREGHQVQGSAGARRRAATPMRSLRRSTISTRTRRVRGATHAVLGGRARKATRCPRWPRDR